MDRRRLVVVAVTGVFLVGFLVIAVLLPPPDPDPPAPAPPENAAPGVTIGEAAGSQLPLDVLASIVKRINVAVAQLENLQLRDADGALQEICDELPEQLLGPRNLTIARLLQFESGSLPRESVAESFEKLKQLAPDSEVTFWLAARISLVAMEQATDQATKADELAAAFAALDRASATAPNNPVYPFAKYEASRTSADPDIQQQGIAALRSAYANAPDNLFVVSEWLLVQAREQDPQIVATLQVFKTTLNPVNEFIKRQFGRDPQQFVDRALAAAMGKDWRNVAGNIRRVLNLLRPQDVAKSDMRLIHPHDLEFVITRLDESLRLRLADPHGEQVEPSSVQLVAQPGAWQLSHEEYRQVRLVDFDLDGDLDLIALADNRLDVFSIGGGADRELLTTIELPSGCRGMLVADLDHDRSTVVDDAGCFDADVDVIVFGEWGLQLLQNELHDGVRSLLAADTSNGGLSAAVRTAILFDLDHDSDLDVIAATAEGMRILSSDGELGFFDVSSYSEFPAAGSMAESLVAVDWDRDADIDVMVTIPSAGAFGWLENLRHGNFRWVAFDASDFGASHGAALFDFDGNTSWDLCGVGAAGTHLLWTSTSPSGVVSRADTESLGGNDLVGVLGWDFDNDGFQDVVAWGRDAVEVRRGNSPATLATTVNLLVPAPADVVNCDVGDVDADGDQDLMVLTADSLLYYRNDGGNQNHWLQVRALGQVDNKGKVNHNGIGSLLEVATSDRYQAQVVNRPVTHFGLGRHETADALRFLWTNGVPQAVIEPRADQAICEKMILKGSCPYLYTWSGERFEFVTDLLWAAPIGLQVAEGQLAPSREWEYLLVEGDRLQAVDGRYELRITEELWEAAYFDQVSLIAVDHPTDVDIFTNEKVGPAEIAEHTIHTARTPLPPIAARDRRGADVLPLLTARDGQFFQGFQKRHLPGLVELHSLELDFGDLAGADRITMFLTGWIYPTDTSLNVAISQNPELAAPRPPYIEVPDASGTWREVVPYMGFPGGKTKTIVVDLSNVFLCHDYRVRIVTSNEIYWDQAFFTIDESPASLQVHELEMVTADLRFRGFSAALPARERSPEVYDYDQTSTADKWPPMRGAFTRFGPVADLLRAADHRLAVLASGDEIALSFAVPREDPPTGWRRDFILHNVGWDKDADLNTVTGQTVEPLPFVGMGSYPYPEREYPASEQQLNYLRGYQNRTIDRTRFWRQMQPAAR